MPNFNNVSFISENNCNYVNVGTSETTNNNSDYTTVTYITEPRHTIVGTKTFTTKMTYAPEIWETPDNPYFDYVSEIKSLTKKVLVEHNQVYINNEFASYRKLAEFIQEFVNIYNRYKNIKSYEEPEMKGDEFNE